MQCRHVGWTTSYWLSFTQRRRCLISCCVHQVWAAPLMGGSRAVVMFNRHVSSDEKFDEHNMTLHWSMIGLPVDLEVRSQAC